MGTYDLFRKISQSNLTSKEREVNQIKYDILADFEDSPSFNTVLIKGVSQDVQIVDENAINKQPNKKCILSKPNETFSIGDMVTWNNNKWLIINIDEDKTIYTTGIIEKCSSSLTLNKNHILSQVPYITLTQSVLTNMGVEQTKYLSVQSDEVIIIVANNVTNRLIDENDIYQLGIKSYQVLSIQDIYQPGLLYIKLKVSEAQQVVPTYAISILNGSEISIDTTQTLQLNCEIKENNIILSPTPTVSYSSSNTEIATISDTGLVNPVTTGSVVFTATYGSVSDTITVNISDVVVDNITYTLVGSIQPDTEIKQTSTKVFIAQKYINGIASVATYDFTISAGTTPSTAYTFTVINDTNCSIKCNSYRYSIVLRATDRVSGEYIEKTITLRSNL